MSPRLKVWIPPLFYSVLAFGLSASLLQFNFHVVDDSVGYIRMGLNFFKGRGVHINAGEPYPFYPRYPPLYPLLIGLINLLLRNPEFSGQLISIFSFSATVIPIFFLSQSVYSRNAAHWASILYITHGFLLIYSNLILTESLFTFLLMTELLLMVQVSQDKVEKAWFGLLLGSVGGMLYLTRPEGLLFFGMGTLAIFFLSSKSFFFKIRFHLLSLAAFLAFLVTSNNLLYQKSPHWQPPSGVSLEMIRRQLDLSHPGNYLEVKKIDWGIANDKKRFKIEEMAEKFNFFEALRAHRFALLRSVFPTLIWRLLEINRYLYAGLGFFFIGAAFLSVPWDASRKRAEFLLLSFFLPVFLCHLIIVFVSRHFFSILPIFLLWIGQGIEIFRQWVIKTFGSGHKASLAVASGLCFFLALPSGWYLHKNLSRPDLLLEHQELGLWMKENIPHIENVKVASGRPFVGYYSGAKFHDLPYVEKFEDLLTFLNHQKTKFFVVGEDLDEPLLGAYRFLLDEDKPLPLGVVRRYILKGRYKLILYEINPRNASVGKLP